MVENVRDVSIAAPAAKNVYEELQHAYMALKERADLPEQLYQLANEEVECLKNQKEVKKRQDAEDRITETAFGQDG